MLLSIIPIDSSIDDEGLTYFAKDALKTDIHVGSLVSIPIKENIRYGIVSKITDDHKQVGDIDNSILPNDIRSIVNIICATPLLAPYQFSLIHSLAKKYFVHAHKVLALFLPKFIFNTLEKKAFEPMIGLNKRQQTVDNKQQVVQFFHNTKNTSLTLYIEEFVQKKTEGVALIFPDDLLLSQVIKKLPNIEKQASISKNSDTYTRRYKNWLLASKQTQKILIGTRRLLQYNLAGYKHILYIEDSLARQTYSYEHIYSNSEILSILAQKGFDITIFSSVPSTESMLKVRLEEYVLQAAS